MWQARGKVGINAAVIRRPIAPGVVAVVHGVRRWFIVCNNFTAAPPVFHFMKSRRVMMVGKTTEQSVGEVEALRLRLSECEEQRTRAENALRSLEDRNRLLGDSAPFGILTLDMAGRITGFNRKIVEMLPWPAIPDLTTLGIHELEPLAATGIVDEFRRCLDTKTTVVSKAFCIGSPACHLRFHISPVPDGSGAVTGMLAFLENISEQKSAEEALRESEERYRMLFQYSPVALVERDASKLKDHIERLRAEGVSDLSGYLRANPQEVFHCMEMIRTVAFNDAFLRMMEAETPEQLRVSLYPTDRAEYFQMALEVILMIAHGSISQERERAIHTLKGNPKNVIIKALTVSGHEDTLARIVISMVDISERKQAEEALKLSERKYRAQALRDNLTGLYNRRYLYQSLSELIERSRAERVPVSLIFMDLDDFKQVVDAFGHLNGSRAIQEVAATIRESIREPAYAVAYAGDEFVVVLPGMGPAQAVECAGSIRERMNGALYLRGEGICVKLRASFGVGTFPIHAEDVTGLLAAADRALFGIKVKGKNSIGLADAPARC
jgi:diguanylate cyclase (GGDEF)-like protein